MYLERAYRQIALISYGNEYLTSSIESEILDRHPLLFNHFPTLRDSQHGTLLCGSASHILNSLKELGATRLSLHIASDLTFPQLESKIFYFSDSENAFCIIAHFPEQQYKVLISCQEKAQWQAFDEHQNEMFSNYSNYYNQTEAYTLHELELKNIQIIEQDLRLINWELFLKEFEKRVYCNAIAKRYGIYPIQLETNNCYEGHLFNHQKEKQYPILPFTFHKNYASNLLENTATLKRQYDAASHPKNEYSDYIQMDDQAKQDFDVASSALSLIHPILIKHCANHYQNSGIHNHHYFTGLQIPYTQSINNNPITSENIFTHHDLETKETRENSETSSFSWWGFITFLSYFLWCYCALWALAYFTVHWGNIFILVIALFFALYKAIKK